MKSTLPSSAGLKTCLGRHLKCIPLSHLPNWKTGSLVNDGVLGEQLALQTLNEKTGLNFKPLQNSSNHGCDGCAVAINDDKITVVVIDAKPSVNGVNAARTLHGDPATRLREWLADDSITQSDPALAGALRSALGSGGVKVQGITVKVGLPATGKTGQAEIKVEPWSKKQLNLNAWVLTQGGHPTNQYSLASPEGPMLMMRFTLT
ncbi:hypothetical protein ACTACG_21540 [Pseudomonas syringae]|uniref:hypothetical protein n=1 Tax=Pseudomonas syringae TaxID=317 RepID=UPI003F74FE68